MAQDSSTSPKQPQASHPRPTLQSTPQANGSATMSEHINTVSVQVSAIRPWITRDVEKFQECGIDEMLKDLLVDCTNKSRKSVDEAYKTRLFERCLDKVLPICNGEDKTPVEVMKGQPHEVKEALETYSKVQTEKELYPVFVRAANTALLFLEELEIEDMRLAEGPTVCFHVSDPTVIIQNHQDHASHRKPDVIVVSNKDVCDGEGLPGDIYTQKDRFLELAKRPPKNEFEWRRVRTFVEFKKAKEKMESPPERYYSQKYTPPLDKYLTLDILSELDLDALPEGPVPSDVNLRPPPPEPMSSRQPKTSAAINSDSNSRKRNSGHLHLSESRSKRPKPTHQREHPAIVQAGYYAAEMFTAHTARLYVISLIVVGDVLYFWRYDRQGTIQCSGFNFIQDLPRFLVLLLAMQRFLEHHWGLNPDIDPMFGPQRESHKTILSDEKGEKVEVSLELSDKERVPHYGLNGRAANLFSVKCENLSDTDDLVAKVFWAEVARTSEPDILQRVYDIGKDDDNVKDHVPDMLWYKAFEDTSTAKVRKRLCLKTEGARVLYMIIFRKLRPITELPGLDLLHVWWGTVKCHLALWKRQVYHRDISPSNLMYCEDKEGKIVGVLNDFDLASTQQVTTGTERTATVPFMASDLLEDMACWCRPARHAYKHDAESFIWVLIWVSLRYDGDTLRKHDRPPGARLRVDAVGYRKERSDFLRSKAARRALEAGKGHEGNWKLANKCIAALKANTPRVKSLPEDQDPSLDFDTAYKTLLSDPLDSYLWEL